LTSLIVTARDDEESRGISTNGTRQDACGSVGNGGVGVRFSGDDD